MQFTDRVQAGRLLAGKLGHLRRENPVVLGLPRGGVPVAAEVARALGAPLDVILVRKLGVPHHRELGYGAIGEDGVRVIRENIVRMSRVSRSDLEQVERAEEDKLRRQAQQFRGNRERVPLEGRTAIIVDDGIATGGTATAACRVARAHGAARVVLAVPVAPQDAVDALRPQVDELVCLSTPTAFFAVGEWYEDFSQTSDEEVVELLERSAEMMRAAHTPQSADATGPGDPPAQARTVELPVETESIRLMGDLRVPEGAPGIVVFAHGSGSSRHSPRNRSVAAALNAAGLGTLLFDLLTPEEELDRANVFDVGTLGRRLVEVTRLLRGQNVPIGYFGASTGAAAALWAAAAAATDPEIGDIAAVVSRGGRPDLAGPRLGAVRAPTLLVVGGRDEIVIDLNRQAQIRMTCENRLVVIPGATHLFEEPGALDDVSGLARDWFLDHLAPAPQAASGSRR